jgi:hypothetical protein
MFQSQSFPTPWSQMLQPTASLVTTSHTGAPSPTSTSHVGDGSTIYESHVNNPHPVTTSHDGGTTLVTMSHINATSPTSVHHVGHDSLAFASHVESMLPSVGNNVEASDVRLNSFAVLAKEITLLIFFQLLLGYQKHGAHLKALQILRHLWFPHILFLL